MNIVVASSRGRGLKEFLPTKTKVKVIGGGSINRLKNEAMKLLPPPHGRKRAHIYFVCGIPDITSLDRIPGENYSESVYQELPHVTVDRYVKKIKNCQNFFVERGAVPVFATIPRVNLAKYNLYLLLNKITSHLKHSDQYKIMQENLDQAIDNINDQIYEINNKIKVSTPFLHHSIRERRGCKGKRYTSFRWEKLFDGLHASKDLHPVWAEILSKSFALNNLLLEDSESEEEERPWRRSAKRPGVE